MAVNPELVDIANRDDLYRTFRRRESALVIDTNVFVSTSANDESEFQGMLAGVISIDRLIAAILNPNVFDK